MRRNPLRIKVLDENGSVKCIYDSIHQYRKIKMSYKFTQVTLRCLKEKRVVFVKGDYICLESTNHVSAFKNRVKYEDKINLSRLDKDGVCRPRNLRRAIINIRNRIVVLNEYFQIDGIHDGTIKELSNIYKIKEGTIKSSLSKTPRRIKQYLAEKPNRKKTVKYTGFYFVYACDLINSKCQ